MSWECSGLQEVTVRDGEAFITYYPGPSARVSGKFLSFSAASWLLLWY